MQLLAEVVRAEGLRGLWRGNPANIVRVIPNKGVLLMCSDMYKETVRPHPNPHPHPNLNPIPKP